MQYTKKTTLLQTLASGDELTISTYTFTGSLAGPQIYLQANLHGPEILGTVILSQIIKKIEMLDDIIGSVVIVPCANPIGVNASGYNSMGGRWNVHNGQNWNRIFYGKADWSSFEQEKAHFESVLERPNLSIEKKLASILSLESNGADYIVDIHTTGYQSMPHIFTSIGSESTFAYLESQFCFSSRPTTRGDSFFGAKTKTFTGFPEDQAVPKGCTWEAGSHNIIPKNHLETQTNKMWNWLNYIWGNIPNIETATQPFKTTQLFTIHSQYGGYYVFQKEVGEDAKMGEVYAICYNPSSGETQEVVAEYDFRLFAIYGTGAIGDGEWLGLGLRSE